MIAAPTTSSIALCAILAITGSAALFGAPGASAGTDAAALENANTPSPGEAGVEAGVAYAAAMLGDGSSSTLVPDGRPYTLRVGSESMTVRVLPESGRVDLNRGAPEDIAAALRAGGFVDAEARKTADVLVDHAQHMPFTDVSELEQLSVDGANHLPDARPFFTVFGSDTVSAEHAPERLLETLDIPSATREGIIAARASQARVPLVDSVFTAFIDLRTKDGAATRAAVTFEVSSPDRPHVLLRRSLSVGAFQALFPAKSAG